MKIARITFVITVSFLGIAAAAPRAPVTAIEGCTLWSGDGPKIENAIIVFEGSKIISAGTTAAPAGARLIDGHGKICTPGLIDAASHLGAVEIDLEPATVDFMPGEGKPVPPVYAHFAPLDGLNPASVLIPIARAGGVTATILQPEGGIVSGRGSLFELVPTRDPAEMVVLPRAAVYAVLGEGSKNVFGGARGYAVARLREALEDAREYGKRKSDYERNQTPAWDERRATLEALGEVLVGRLPLVIQANRASDLLVALRLAKEFGFHLVLEGAAEGWRVADAIAQAHVPVIARPMSNDPESFESLAERYENPALLAAAGVKVAFTTLGGAPGTAHNLRTLTQEAGNAVAYGMDYATAMRAVTRTPAEIFGANELGIVAPGKTSDIVVWSGDPFEISSRPLHVFVRGVDVPLVTRQTALFEKYRKLH